MKPTLYLFATLLVFFSPTLPLFSHCEIPCGIYGDEARFQTLLEDISTVEKSMNKINELSKEKSPNQNQLVRWVVNKENHANNIQEIATQYFLHQRIKPTDSKDEKVHALYLKKLEVLHHILVYAMKAKQSTDLTQTAKLKSLVSELEVLYFEKKK